MIPRNSTENTRKSYAWSRSRDISDERTDEYLLALKRAQKRKSSKMTPGQIMSPRERHRTRPSQIMEILEGVTPGTSNTQQATRISTIASMVPDEIIYRHSDHSVRSYETALMFIDVSGFTELCESYTKPGKGGPSRLTQILNTYIGAMVQEILMHNGDILNFSGDAFLTMWKKTPKMTMQDIVHTAIDCGLLLQKNYENYVTDSGVVLKVKIAISAGVSHFSIIGGEGQNSQSHYVIVGQPVWDVKMAEYMSTAGDVLTSGSAWIYVNEAEYCTQPCGDGRHTKVLGIGAAWKRVENPLHSLAASLKESESAGASQKDKDGNAASDGAYYRVFSLRPAVVSALKSSWWPGLRQFMVTPVLRAVDNDEPMDFLTEVRRVVVVFLNIVTKTVTHEVLLGEVDAAYKCVCRCPGLRQFMVTPVLRAVDNDEPMDFLTEVRGVVVVLNIVTKTVTHEVLLGEVDAAYKCVCRLTSELGGLVNKVSMFDKDMMFLVVFGLRGLKQEDEARKALLCASELMESLSSSDSNITSVSIGVTSGTTYCGVVGHVLRREYTVIGPTVNMAARMMMAYPMRVTCDKETFLRSKLDQEHFRMVEEKTLKGIPKPGPIYEFNKYKWSERKGASRHPILGRNEELRRYKKLICDAMKEHKRKFTRYKDLVFAFAIIGPELVGKTRFLEECIHLTPHECRVETFLLTESEKEPFVLFRMLMTKAFASSDERKRVNFEDILRYHVNVTSLSVIQLYALNLIFDCRFPLPENFKYQGDCLYNLSVKLMLQGIFKNMFPNLWVAAVKGAHNIDDQSWRLLIIMLETKTIFIIMTIDDEYQLSEIARKALENNMIAKIMLGGIDRWYHGALACQLLDVQAIPADLEKIIESASGGLPGWIQNFVISLVQRGVLTVVTVLRSEAKEAGAIMPSSALLQRADYDGYDKYSLMGLSYHSIYSAISGLSRQESQHTDLDSDVIQMAVLDEGYTFDDMTVDMAMDAIILKTYDSLNPFEKMLLKCGSVLGDVFSRRMLLYLLQSDSPRKVAQAVAKLLMIRVLECEGGDFTRDASMVLVRPAPAIPAPKPPYCACLGIRPPPTCRDLPPYAFCGYMRFRHAVFRTTTYELLTESQKHDLHLRALLYLERYTRRCISCGLGCFAQLLGERSDDGLVVESEALKRTKQQIRALNAEARATLGVEDEPASYFVSDASEITINDGKTRTHTDFSSYNEDKINFRQSLTISKKDNHVRSFASFDISSCECLSILLTVYCQIIEHCRGAGEYEKLFEAYLEYADLNIINQNVPQAIRLLFEVETFVKGDKLANPKAKWDWMQEFRLAKIYTLRGSCMLESGDIAEAKKNLLYAMELYHDPFPTSKHSVRLRSMRASIRQRMALYLVPNWYVGVDSGVVGRFYEDIAKTLSTLYKLFTETKEFSNAALAAKWSLNYALRTNANFRIMCNCYANMITTYRMHRRFSICQKLEKRAVELCHRKRGQIDITEVHAVCYLYTSIFLFYVEHGKKVKSLEFGLSVMSMLAGLTDPSTCQVLILWMLKLLLSDLRIHDMVNIMRQFFYTPDHYDLSSETWYYCYAMIVLLDTGYCVESYGTCERFYIRKGDGILRARTPEAAWTFFVCMWLVTVRVGAWEKSILWEEKIQEIVAMKFEKNEFNIMILMRLAEGLLITLVKEMDNRNIKNIVLLERTLKGIFQDYNSVSGHMTMFKPRYYLLYAYFHYVRGKKYSGYHYLNKCVECCKNFSLETLLIWAEHTRNHWKGTLNANLENYWADHIESDQSLDYRDFDVHKSKIVPYTLPLPRDFET